MKGKLSTSGHKVFLWRELSTSVERPDPMSWAPSEPKPTGSTVWVEGEK